MNASRVTLFLSVIAGGGLLVTGSPVRSEFSISSTRIVAEEQLARSVGLRDVEAKGGDISGVLVNTSGKVVRDVELLIRYAWLWNDEFRPGVESPGRVVYFTVRGEIPPGGREAFTYRVEPPLAGGSEGRFLPSVEVVGLAEAGG
jgi:hypothetical protein